MAFTAETIGDQKRLVRGEQLLAARTYLRVRDHAHNRAWRVLILAGPAPSGEVNAIRDLMPKAHIVALDRDPACLEAAISAGVDEVLECDLADMVNVKSGYSQVWKMSPILEAQAKFDLVSLDMCGLATPEMRRIFSVHRRLLMNRSAFLVTFSYGRDVVEVYREAFHRPPRDEGQRKRMEWIHQTGISQSVVGRLMFLFPTSHLASELKSVMTYRGAEMPMVSALFHPGNKPVSYIQVTPGDFELAVTAPDPAKLYDCPRERIESLRRSHAAIKAAYTRTGRDRSA